MPEPRTINISMKKSVLLSLLLLSLAFANAQVYATRNGFIGFYSKTPLEDIKAENKQVYAGIDVAKKNIAFNLLVKGFSFNKKLMQDHFNEEYIESDKYPNARFSGTYTGDVDVTKDGTYKVQAQGQLTLHGVTKPIEVPAVIEVKDGKLIGKSDFKLTPSDFNIKIPSLVREKIAQQIDVHVSIDCSAIK
jgi:polyisoprenoid-binding protein YceI